MNLGSHWKDLNEDVWKVVADFPSSGTCDVMKVAGPSNIRVGYLQQSLNHTAVYTYFVPHILTDADPADECYTITLNYPAPRPRHVCEMVLYDTGLPNSRRFRYCSECNKEETIYELP